jgi:hypothetical protein
VIKLSDGVEFQKSSNNSAIMRRQDKYLNFILHSQEIHINLTDRKLKFNCLRVAKSAKHGGSAKIFAEAESRSKVKLSTGMTPCVVNLVVYSIE